MASPTMPRFEPREEPQLATLGWAIRRAVLGLAILLVTVSLVAWLFNASIEPDASTSGPASHSEYALP